MIKQKARFLAILKVELDDLKDDLDMLISECAKQYEEEKVTHYVCLENLATFKNEILGVNAFQTIIDQTNPDDYPDLAALKNHLHDRFRTVIQAAGLVPAVCRYIDRKMRKVTTYVTAGSVGEHPSFS